MHISLDNRSAGFTWNSRSLLVLPFLTLLVALGIRADAKTEVVTPLKSVFVDKPEFGRDPFFPNSDRRKVQVQAATNTSSLHLGFPEDIYLKGLSGVEGAPLAIINNTTFSVGETLPVRVNGAKVKVQCLEIKDRSVLVSINGKVRELFLRKDL